MEKTVEMASLEFLILFKSSVVAFTLQLLFVVINQRERKEIPLQVNIHMPGCYRMENAEKITNSIVNGCLDVQFLFMQGGYRRGKCESTEGKTYWQTN